MHDLDTSEPVTLLDSEHRAYATLQPGETARIGGAIGTQYVQIREEYRPFRVAAETDLQESTGQYRRTYLRALYTMLSEGEAKAAVDLHGELGEPSVYPYLVLWLRDHVHVLKGMKYFTPTLKPGIDLYSLSQRADGMIWDNAYPRTDWANYWEMRFKDGNYISVWGDQTHEFKRIPVEADVEYLFVEGIYATWQATGDSQWMRQQLPRAVRALEYCQQSSVRWSQKYQLVKRGYTIDTWDFQNSYDIKVNGDAMRIDPERTRFGVMFGDSTGLAAGYNQLAKMSGESASSSIAEQVWQRIDDHCWQGNGYRHWLPEDGQLEPRLGVDERSQISLSNAYSLNRGMKADHARAVIDRYRQLSTQLPAGSPGEWYTIYPPFQSGFGAHNGIYQYMNASVTPIVAGELARGAFVHGRESYGADILRRVGQLGDPNDPFLHCSYTGAVLPRPETTFTPVRTLIANRCYRSPSTCHLPPFSDDADNDLQTFPAAPFSFEDIPIEPIAEGVRMISRSTPDEVSTEISASGFAKSVYLLHGVSKAGPAGIVGTLRWNYQDGSSETVYVRRDHQVHAWWLPEKPTGDSQPDVRIAWNGPNPKCLNVALSLGYVNNPHPDRELDSITLESGYDGGLWFVCGATFSDQPGYFDPHPVSFGIPSAWGAAAVMYALVEGLAGVIDTAKAFEAASVSPKWAYTDADRASACIVYPASQGYVAYQYARSGSVSELLLTGSGTEFDLNLPSFGTQNAVEIDGTPTPATVHQEDESSSLRLSVPNTGRPIRVRWHHG
ncbi:MAG: hypothetical protein SFX74_03955 [Fimbriimonadaceae bacterium]|nr:hypothetical protein [Fimbriimonadaceae bacterium]